MMSSSSLQRSWLALVLFSQLLRVAALTFHWPSFTIPLQLPLIVGPFDHSDSSPSGRFNSHSPPSGPFDEKVHLPNGAHYMLDFHNVTGADLTFLETAEAEAFISQEIIRSGMTLLGSRSHLFPGGGLTTVFLLSESHISIHTWPEYSFVALDIYTCGNPIAAEYLARSMHALLKPGAAEVSCIERGSTHYFQTLEMSSLTGEADGKNETMPIPIRQPTLEHPLRLSDTHRSDLLALPVTVDICVNADFQGEDCYLWRNASLLYSQHSGIQLVEVVERQFGDRCLLLDGIVQFCDSVDNALYTHSLTESVMRSLLPATQTFAVVYVVGGGDGWIGTHLLTTYPDLIHSIHVVDIDPMVSGVTQEFFSVSDGIDSFNDPRAKYVVGDAAVWLHSALNASADAVIIDCTDHTVESASVLYTDSFYSDILRVLKPGGRFSQQMNTLDHRYEQFQNEARESWLKLGFVDVAEWQLFVESYGGIIIMMSAMKSRV